VIYLQPAVTNPTGPNPESVAISSPRAVVDPRPTTLSKKSSCDNTGTTSNKENLPLKNTPTAPETVVDCVESENTTPAAFTRPYSTIADENSEESHSNTVHTDVLTKNITHPSSMIPDKNLEESYSNTIQILAESSNLPLEDISAQIIVSTSKVVSSAFCMI
jgi:hypothetical protein